MENTKQVIGFFGTGLMGKPMIEHLLAASYTVYVYNRTKSKAQPLIEKGAHVVDTKEEAIINSKIIISMLFDKNAICSTILANKELLVDKIFIQMSTISPKESLSLKEEVESVGAQFIEAPVLGTTVHAEKAILQVLVGCNFQQFQNVYINQILSCFGKVIHVGEIPSASTLKLSMNQMVVGLTSVFGTSLAMVKEAGVSEDIFMSVLKDSAFFFPYTAFKLPLMSNRQFLPANFEIEGAKKDIELIREEASRVGLDTSIIEGVQSVVNKAADQYSQHDFAVLYNTIYPPPPPPSSSSSSSSSSINK